MAQMKLQVEWCEDLGQPGVGVIMNSDSNFFLYSEARAWIEEMGIGHWLGAGLFYIRKPEDRTLFMLKWCA